MKNFILEAKIVWRDERPDGRFVVYENPTRNEIQTILEKSKEKILRGLVSNEIFVWDAYFANHDQVESFLNLRGYEQITISEGSLEFDRADDEYDPTDDEDGEPIWNLDSEMLELSQNIVQSNPIISKLFHGWTIEIVVTLTDDGWEEPSHYNGGIVN